MIKPEKRETLHQVICEVTNDCEETAFVEEKVMAWHKSDTIRILEGLKLVELKDHKSINPSCKVYPFTDFTSMELSEWDAKLFNQRLDAKIREIRGE